MLSHTKRAIQAIFRVLGLEVYRRGRAPSPCAALARELESRGIITVFDIGANVGQFAESMRRSGYRGRIISIEPLPAAHAELLKRAKRDSSWLVHPRGAATRSGGTIVINVSSNSVSSSPLEVLPSHTSAAPESMTVAKVECTSWPLDEIVGQYCHRLEPVFVKIDTQGFEAEVLAGGTATIERAQGLMLELSLVPLYEGQSLWRTLVDQLEDRGLQIWRIDPAFEDRTSGQTLQVDAMFFRHLSPDENHDAR
jgi:FkbM family methyltransferase